MSDANQRIKELQEKLKLQLETLAPRKAELEALSKAAYQEFSNAEEAERTCFSALLELKKKNRDFLQEKLMEQLDYQQRSEQIENEILRLTRRLKFIDLTIIYRNLDAGYQKMMSKYQISPECDLSKKYIDLIDITNEAAKNFQELHKETEAVRMTYNALKTTHYKLSIN